MFSLRKRYEKAEAEYVTAKLDLHKKTEVKEQLTEHLCAIIQQNELRKAHKLEELMQQLQLQEKNEEQEEEEEKDKEEEKKKSCEETTQENGSVEKQEETLKSEEEKRGEAKETEEESKTVEISVQSLIVAS